MSQAPGAEAEKGQEYWTEVIERARAFKAGVYAYCNKYKISKKLYYGWFKRLRAEHPEWTDLSGKRKIKKTARRVKPLTEVVEKATRRRFSAKEKLRILQAADAAPQGEVAALLRREGIYASQLTRWRAERDAMELANKKRGPKPNPHAAEVKQLRAANERLEKKLEQANRLIELQKKVSEILGVTLEQFDDED